MEVQCEPSYNNSCTITDTTILVSIVKSNEPLGH